MSILTPIERNQKIKKVQKQMKEALLAKDVELYNSLYFDLQAFLKYKV
jgi:predicted GIY-YIG superfamily endonuclease